MLVYNQQRHLWIGQRYGTDVWQFPQGGVEPELTLEQNVRKELKEELGLSKRVIGAIEKLEAVNRYNFVDTPIRWKTKYRGQAQTFWTVEFSGTAKDINLEKDAHPEFSDWAWCPLDQVLERVEPLRRAGYQAPLAEFRSKFFPG